MDRWKDGWMSICQKVLFIQIDRMTNGRMGERMEKSMDGCKGGWINGLTDGWMDGWMSLCQKVLFIHLFIQIDQPMDGWMDRWTDRSMNNR